MKLSVNIVGAGIAGLATAIRLASRGHHVTVFEQSDKPGGKINTFNGKDSDGIRARHSLRFPIWWKSYMYWPGRK